MSDDINPRYVDGEPLCSLAVPDDKTLYRSVCPYHVYYDGDHCSYPGEEVSFDSGMNPPYTCIPALRRDRDAEKARAEAAEAEVFAARARIEKLEKRGIGSLPDKYLAIRNMSKQDRREIYKFALECSVEMLPDTEEAPDGE